MSQDQDQGTKAGVVVAFAVIAVALVVALGMALRQSFKSAAVPVVAAEMQASAAADQTLKGRLQ